MEKILRLLIVEDVAADARLMERELRRAGIAFRSKRVETKEAFVKELRDFPPDLILSDYSLPQFDGMTALSLAKELAPSAPFIMVTGSLSEETAVECMKSGAADYVIKEHLVRLVLAVKSALERKTGKEEKERADEKLRRNEELFRGMVETAGEGIWLIDQDGNTTFVNKKMADMLGYTVPEMIAKPLFDFMDEEGREIARSTLARRGQGIAEQHDLKLRRGDGTDLWAIVSMTPFFDKDERYTGALGMITDITERKRFERELAERAAELARSNAELEQFSYVAAHDLKEPLRNVTNYVQLLAKRYTGKLDPDADKFIAFVVDGVRRMHELIHGLLVYSQVSSQKTPEPVGCEAVFESALMNLQAAIEESGASVAHDPLPTVLADPFQLCQLFQNLIGNAVKFHGQEAPRVHVSASQKDSEWVFSVRDNGIGIDPKYADRIFVLFQRLHHRADYPGTGIGLAICRKIVERHGGRIWVESESGKGAVFYFTIPKEAICSAPEAMAVP